MQCVQECILQLFFSLRLVLNLCLIFIQVSGSCSYKIILIKKGCKGSVDNTFVFGLPRRGVMLILVKEHIVLGGAKLKDFRGPGQKRKMRPFASEASREFLGSSKLLWKMTFVVLYEAPRL